MFTTVGMTRGLLVLTVLLVFLKFLCKRETRDGLESDPHRRLEILGTHSFWFVNFACLVYQSVWHLPEILLLCDQGLCQVTTLGRHLHLGPDVIHVLGMDESAGIDQG